jgi:predicted N-formylglutamate amidohydrolase
LNNKQYAAAAELFGKVSADENYMPYYREMSRWYQVVAVSNVDERKAKELLEAIEQTPNTKYEISAVEKMKMKIRLAF